MGGCDIIAIFDDVAWLSGKCQPFVSPTAARGFVCFTPVPIADTVTAVKVDHSVIVRSLREMSA